MRSIVYILALLLLVQCKPKTNETVVATKADHAALVSEVLDQWHLDAAETNYESYFNAMSNDGVFIGTDPSENWTVEEFKVFCKPYFDQQSAWDFKAVERQIYFDETQQVSWFDELLETWMGICRGSGVLVNDGASWKIKHYVLSLTIPNDNIQGVIELNKEKDSLFLERKKLLQ